MAETLEDLKGKLAMLGGGFDPEQHPRRHLVAKMRADLERNKRVFGHLPGRAEIYAENEAGINNLEASLLKRHAERGAEIERLKAAIAQRMQEPGLLTQEA